MNEFKFFFVFFESQFCFNFNFGYSLQDDMKMEMCMGVCQVVVGIFYIFSLDKGCFDVEMG